MTPPTIPERVESLERRMTAHEKNDEKQSLALTAISSALTTAENARAALKDMVDKIDQRLSKVEWKIGLIVGLVVLLGQAVYPWLKEILERKP